ncbi:hypothetical protein A3D06_02500 [Candidatus Roizmanbacteria bacterium RIFCSPHIGHO2_02_FULL_40_9]|uniref:CAAX prenyl protease 2/Lysostaphin resistance protein A-like domain-containing protein n=1 Tax=Candidatus Roizmanbacteria bacterium RIFCSPHIGHO2_02_FULL_40_9 TaxID=1802042 RepID=A0A1F7HD67_9BACT|nr:MAG: hypothetical protein A3D06_02500 [Candidatus Roizmanbacteria bacterium RIFCSPHIGHO2_02_FULL_40_9]
MAVETRRDFFSRFDFRRTDLTPEETGLIADDALPTEPAIDLSRRGLLGLGLGALAGVYFADVLPKPAYAAYRILTNPPAEQPDAPSGPPAAVVPITQTDDSPTEAQTEEFDEEGDPLLIGAIQATYSYAMTRPPVAELATNISNGTCDALGIPKGSYRETVMQAIGLISAMIPLTTLVNLFGIKSGNQSFEKGEYEDYLNNHFLKMLIEGGVIAPVVEEALFRLLPSFSLDLLGNISSKLRPDPRVFWPLGITQATLFGLIHNIQSAPDGSSRFARSLPFEQTTMGLSQWYMMREKGLRHAILCHGTFNTVALSMGKFLSR